jgi:hypothetical protein
MGKRLICAPAIDRSRAGTGGRHRSSRRRSEQEVVPPAPEEVSQAHAPNPPGRRAPGGRVQDNPGREGAGDAGQRRPGRVRGRPCPMEARRSYPRQSQEARLRSGRGQLGRGRDRVGTIGRPLRRRTHEVLVLARGRVRQKTVQTSTTVLETDDWVKLEGVTKTGGPYRWRDRRNGGHFSQRRGTSRRARSGCCAR